MRDVAAKPPPILPSDRRSDRALFHVIAVFTLLLTLTLLAFSSGFRASSGWGQSLSQSVTVQIKSPGAQAMASVQGALSNIPGIEIETLSEDQARALLKPWLGDAALPEDLPIPRLLDVHFEGRASDADIAQIRAALMQTGVDVDVDDHSYWLKDLRRKTRIFQAAILLSTLLILSALISAVIYATRASVSGWRTLMRVMDHIGAAPKYTARLFALRFFKLSLKAGSLGAAAALVFALVISLFWTQSGLLPSFAFKKSMILFALITPLLVSLLSAGTAWRTVNQALIKRLYP